MRYPAAGEPPKTLCKILKSHDEIVESTRYLHYHGYEPHAIPLKNWDLASVIPEIKDGHFLDMGSSDSYILQNLALKKVKGELHGMDLRLPDHPVKGVQYTVGDVLNTSYPDSFFTNVTCLSVIEHQVDFTRFARESSRLLKNGGKLFVTFDYWEPKVVSHIKLFGLEWLPLDCQAAEKLLATCKRYGLFPVQDMDWTLGEPLVHKDNFSPDPEVSYTFGMLTLEKRE